MFIDLPTKKATTLEDMKSYIENARLEPREVQAALDEQVHEPYPRNKETAARSPFNYSAVGSEIRVGKSSAETVEFSFTFPIEDFGAQ